MNESNHNLVSHVILDGILKPIDLLLNTHHLRSALILLYSGIDTMAFLDLPTGRDKVERKDFISWVERYIHFCPKELTGIDLYGARCGVLHTYRPESDLSKGKRARRLLYFDFNEEPAIRYNPAVSEDDVLVSLPALVNAFFNGVAEFIKDLARDKEKGNLAVQRCNTMFAVVPSD